jgi:hypothetical protein
MPVAVTRHPCVARKSPVRPLRISRDLLKRVEDFAARTR